MIEMVYKIRNPRIIKDNGMMSRHKVTWDCVYFGMYPQAEVVPTGNYTAIGSEYLQSGDTIVDDSLYAALQSATGWDSNGDITLNGKKYRRMKRGDATYRTSGNSVYYNWSDSTIFHYFKYEPIKWRVLNVDGDRALILADKALDDRQYNTIDEAVTWEKSTIRSFLNGYDASANQRGIDFSDSQNFLATAFSSNQQAAIFDSTVIQSDSLYNTSESARGNDTVDKIFLLSDSEVYGTDKARSYGFVSNRGTNDEARRSRSSTYAKAMWVWCNTSSSYKGNCVWWLRSTGYYSRSAMNVYCDGCVHTYYDVSSNSIGVRPASFLNLKYTNLYSYAGTVCSDGTFDETHTIKKEEKCIEKNTFENDIQEIKCKDDKNKSDEIFSKDKIRYTTCFLGKTKDFKEYVQKSFEDEDKRIKVKIEVYENESEE